MPESDEPSVDDTPVWWVLIDGSWYMRNPVEDASEAIALHDELVRLVARRGISRDRVSLVRVGKAWGWANYVGS